MFVPCVAAWAITHRKRNGALDIFVSRGVFGLVGDITSADDMTE
jgi:hypothetical protein